MVEKARSCERWLLVVMVGALLSARSCNLLPDNLNLDDDPSDDGDGSFWSQRSYGGYVDDFLVKLRHAVVDDGLDPLEPPDEVQDIDERSGLSTWHADVRLEPRDMRALRKDSAAFDACQRHVQQQEDDQELGDVLLSYMFLGRVLRVAPAGDIFGQQEELRTSIERWVETLPLLVDASPWSKGHASRFIHIRNRQLTRHIPLTASGARRDHQRRHFWRR
ncbi:uncharacterized protein LOC126428303 [Schistocerca serialis cubense]|uniref:uncharacterized protein LOC126428303 n=1 Tax=Schistocerca serialis cubense TaxID=2023355 RepID=UPI00214E3704|nr:uncharacterized protein LOC126428303 [Schistocerca serialis cubense]